jgi:starch-binding outer membrane protein, SusD/RagB family
MTFAILNNSRKIGLATTMTFCFTMLTFVSCRKFVQVPAPQTQLVTANVFSNDLTAKSAMNGIYVSMLGYDFASGGVYSVTYNAGLSADEFLNFSTDPDMADLANNTLSPTNGQIAQIWSSAYSDIYGCNAVLAGLSASTGVSSEVKQELIGEAKFVRAFCYFYLVNLFGAVPLDTTTIYQVNAGAPRSSVNKVYSQIVTDLENAQSLLDNDFSVSGGERIRPNKWAAAALLARVYLFEQDWSDAEAQSTQVINNSSLFSLCRDLDSVFLKNSAEAIWQLCPVSTYLNTNEGSLFILLSPPSNVSLTQNLLNAFEAGDLRKAHWVGNFPSGVDTFFFPYKYKVEASSTLTEYSMVLRLAEQFLIRAEARAQQGTNLTGAAADLNMIRSRAGLTPIQNISQDSLLTLVLHERQVELFSEWGHRWLDLSRTGTAQATLSSLKPAWNATDLLYPIPDAEIQNNPSVTQNPGY